MPSAFTMAVGLLSRAEAHGAAMHRGKPPRLSASNRSGLNAPKVQIDAAQGNALGSAGPHHGPP